MTCRVPPPGWSCTREAGHEGPCAAVPSFNPQGRLPLDAHFRDPLGAAKGIGLGCIIAIVGWCLVLGFAAAMVLR